MSLYPQSVASQGAHPNSFSFYCLHLWIRSWVHQGVWVCIICYQVKHFVNFLEVSLSGWQFNIKFQNLENLNFENISINSNGNQINWISWKEKVCIQMEVGWFHNFGFHNIKLCDALSSSPQHFKFI